MDSWYSTDRYRRSDFIKYGWREAIQEGLKEEYPFGGRKLWAVMVSEYSDHFSGEYPCTEEARNIALKNFKLTKQEWELEWALANAPIFLPKLIAKLQELDIFTLFPSDLWCIIVEYAETGATWVDV